MSTDASALPRPREFDNPWRRLPWTLPLSLLIWTAVLWAFALFTEGPRQRLPEPPPIEAQLIELPPEPASPSPPTPKAPPRPALEPTRTPPQRTPPPKAAPLSAHAPSLPAAAPTPSAPPAPAAAQEAPARPPPPPSAAAPSTGGKLSASGGAQAIVKPMPRIPDELREEALHVVVTARFHVAADGSATVELVKPTPNLRLNRLLLDTLRQWKFFPALRDGQPTASTEEIAIHIDVK